MKHLLDANVLLEAALRRQHWESARDFLARVPSSHLAISTFTLHSLGFYLTRRTPEVFDAIVSDIVSRAVSVLDLEPSHLTLVTHVSRAHRLDFDDAFIYVIAEMHDLKIVSFDTDFDHTPRGRCTPEQALAELPPAAAP